MKYSLFGLILLCLPLQAQVSSSQTFDVGGANIQLNIEDDFNVKEQDVITRWLKRYSQALAGLYGRFPLTDVQLSVNRASYGKGPVPWAEVMRDEPEGVRFYLSENVDSFSLMADWTAAHELSHLLMPYPGQSDVWLSEGLASWYQGILMFNAGLKSEQALWQGLVEGFNRADNSDFSGSLSQASRKMKTQHSYMRVYWVGAAYYLQMEYVLQLHGEQLLAVLSSYQSCCRSDNSYQPGVKFVISLDEQLGISLFRFYYEQWRDSTAMPDMSAPLAWFGVSIEDGRVVLDDEHISAMRRAQLYKYPVEVPKSRLSAQADIRPLSSTLKALSE